ncbi:hypothetical protein BAUCODRAFT_29842 [Baudoinia panamericana UAMH 10762]|uniref:Wax synthase domain-containing protein n=1 Tax=Baudoinia panamericana (strain UAMH 10762) TaxID=717646 RepID=M2MRQ8_BAUPA|nr:uncharacterized protein BAUCODRAFT_29842 [Baudoinia panamericana UAMH 10762]EMC99496.1 hypothetical protein BAUCODRAFT_29842 [Baudoinia panamericana UAMH 10762]
MALLAPYTIANAHPLLVQPGLRCICFFYSCKLLDLAFTKADPPPTRLIRKDKGGELEAASMETWNDATTYVWLMFAEMRYHSFDTAVEQRGRPGLVSLAERRRQQAWTFGIPTLLIILVCLLPTAETKIASLLAAIQLIFQLLHTLLHPSCPHPLFYMPFAAASMSDFWTIHWHASAPFLRTLAYSPTRKVTGSRAAGMMAAFCLSGIWHAWCAAPLAIKPWLLAFNVWAYFMGFGIVILAERWLWGTQQGGMIQRLCVWAYAIGVGGYMWRILECNCKLDWVRTTHCT